MRHCAAASPLPVRSVEERRAAAARKADMVMFTNRGTMSPAQLVEGSIPPLQSETYEEARHVAPGWDVRFLEREWRDWCVEPPRHADRAFIGFCRKWFKKRGRP